MKINIYSEYDLVYKLLIQIYPQNIVRHYNSLILPELCDHNVLIFDCDSIDWNKKLYDKFHNILEFSVCILVTSGKAPKIDSRAIVLKKPFYYTSLIEEIDSINWRSIMYINPKIIINSNTKRLIKVGSKSGAIQLTEREYGFVKYLYDRPADAGYASEKEILQNVFLYKGEVDSNTVKTHFYKIKQKIGDDFKFIEYTNNGYKLIKSNGEKI